MKTNLFSKVSLFATEELLKRLENARERANIISLLCVGERNRSVMKQLVSMFLRLVDAFKCQWHGGVQEQN